jgi:hypothetical protein
VGDVLLLAMWLENIMKNVEAEKEEQEYSRDWANSGAILRSIVWERSRLFLGV